jgi:uncharacterized protein YfaP (DUF2135 family)
MKVRMARLSVIGGFCILCLVLACSVEVGREGLSISLLGRTVQINLGPSGLTLRVRSNQATQADPIGFRLFDGEPSQTPPGGSMILRSSDVGVARVLSSKQAVRAQTVSVNGTATVVFSVAAGQSAALCDSATFLAEYELRLAGGALSVADEVYELSQQALSELMANDVTVCIEVTADFDGEITFYDFSFSFDGGSAGQGVFNMYNADTMNIHILLPGENFDESNRITPGAVRDATLSGINYGDTITVRAGRNGAVLDTTTCPTVVGENYTAYIDWDGFSVTCDAAQVGTAGRPPEPAGTQLQVPIDSLGNAVEPTETYGGVDYALVGVLNVSSSTTYPATLPSNITSTFGQVDINLNELGLQYVEQLYFSTHAAWVPDLPNGIRIATLTCDYLDGGPPTVLDFTLGSTTAEWSYDRPDHDIQFGGVTHDIIPILYSFPTTSIMGYDYEGHVFSENLSLDASRTLSLLTLELGSEAEFAASRLAEAAPPTWAGQGIVAMTLVGPASGAPGPGPGPSGTGTVTGQVVNAQTGEPLSGALVTVSGAGLSATTDGSGNFTITGVPEGGQTLVATLTGFVQTSVPVVMPANATAETSIGMLAVGAGGDNVAAVLAWGENPRDLDLHMSGPDGSGGRFHAYYSAKTPVPHVFLDLDDTSSFGPETMTVTPDGTGSYVPGDYHVWIHHYAGDLSFAESAATVTLFAGGAQIAQYSVGGGTGDSSQRIWQVVEFTVSETGAVSNIRVVQSFTDGSSSSVF